MARAPEVEPDWELVRKRNFVERLKHEKPGLDVLRDANAESSACDPLIVPQSPPGEVGQRDMGKHDLARRETGRHRRNTSRRSRFIPTDHQRTTCSRQCEVARARRAKTNRTSSRCNGRTRAMN